MDNMYRTPTARLWSIVVSLTILRMKLIFAHDEES